MTPFLEFIYEVGKSIAPVIPVAWAIINSNKERKKEHKVVADGLRELNAQNEKTRSILDKREDRLLFDQSLTSALQDTRSQAIRTCRLSDSHKTLLRKWSKLLEDLAPSYYYHKYRGIKYKMKNFLDVELADIETRIKAIIRHDVRESKVIKYDFNGNSTVITFYEWIFKEENRQPFNQMQLLGLSLEHNGFDDKTNPDSPDFIDTMDENLNLILDSYINVVREWMDIKEPEMPETALEMNKELNKLVKENYEESSIKQ